MIRGLAAIAAQVRVRARSEQVAHNIGAAVVGSPHERRPALAVLLVNLCSAVKQQRAY